MKDMTRADDGLAFMLRYENVAWYADGEVRILDRRVYPARVEYVSCRTCQEVAQAIGAMVTQSGGPRMAALQGLILAAHQVQHLSPQDALCQLERDVHVLSHARPTTSAQMFSLVQGVLNQAKADIYQGKDIIEAVTARVMQATEARYHHYRQMAENLMALIPDGASILTQCFAELLMGFTLLVSKERGKNVSLICPETRPYFQGARLTASVARDMEIPVTVVTDNMPAAMIVQGMVDVFVSAADAIALDGHVVNKVGTFGIALACHYHGVPYYVGGIPSPEHPTGDTIVIEERDPNEVLSAMGVRTAKQGVCGFYPAFDVTPPRLVSAVVTAEGIFSPYDLARHFACTPAAKTPSPTSFH
jgi:methylthioribose-1-phosphate isomerase